MAELKLSDIRKELPFKIQKNMNQGHLFQFDDYLKTGRRKIDFDVFLPTIGKNLQRDFVWTQHQKEELIRSIIKGCDIQTFSVIIYSDNDRMKESTFKIIDGKQRLSTLLDFFNNKFTVNLLGNDYFYNELPKDIQREIAWFDIYFNQTYEFWDDLISDEDKIAWFEQINFAGTPQDIKHMNSLKNK